MSESVCLRMPDRIGRYRVVEEISRGGSGVVYRAVDDALKREVAIKVLLAGALASREAVRRLFLEASAAARLSHRNIVPVLEIGGGDEGNPFLVMPYYKGGTAARRWGQGDGQGPSIKEILVLARKVALAVHHAHQHGILHRDLKPGNILFDDEDEPLVADFGLARVSGEDLSLTLSHAVVGTPAYMSPEQALGAGSELTITSDIHSLGGILYEWIAGRPPYIADSIPSVLKALESSQPVSPLSLRRQRHSVVEKGVARSDPFSRTAHDLETICLKCLEKEPGQRYETALALAEDLGRCLNDEPIVARPISKMERVWRWCRRNPMAASFVTVVILLLLIVIVGGPVIAAREAALAREVQRASYASDLAAASQALNIANVTHAQDLLDRHKESDLREFTWRYLSKSCESMRTNRFLIDPSPHPFGGVVSRDGSLFGTVGMYGHLTLWDVVARKQLHHLRTGGHLVEYGDFSPDGTIFVSTGGHAATGTENDFRVWDVNSGELRIRKAIPSLAGEFSPDGRWFACGLGRERSGELVLLDTQNDWKESKSWSAHSSEIWSIRWSHSGALMLTSGMDQDTITLWDISSAKTVHTLRGHQATVTCADFAPDDRTLVTGSDDASVRFWDAETGSEIAQERYAHFGAIIDVEWSSDGNWVVSSGHDGFIRLQNRASGLEWTLRGHSMSVNSVGFAMEDSVLISVSPDRTIGFWDLTALPPPDTPLEGLQEDPFHSPVAFSSDSEVIATSNLAGTSVVWTAVTTGRELGRWSLSATQLGRKVGDLMFVSKGRLAVADVLVKGKQSSGKALGAVRIVDLVEQEVVDHYAGTAPLAFSPQKRLLASQGKAMGSIQIRDLDKSTSFSVEAFDGEWIGDIAFSPDGSRIAVGGSRRSTGYGLFLLDPMTRKIEGRFEGERYKAPINAISFTRDGARIITVGLAAKVQIWDVETLRLISEVPGHSGHGRALAISPDGRTLATGSNAGVLKLWSINAIDTNPRELLTMRAHQDSILSLGFSADGSVLASGGRDGNVRLWHAVREKL